MRTLHEGYHLGNRPLAPTPRQLEVFAAYCRTGDRKAAADACGIGDQGVKNHLSNLYRRLGVEGLGALAAADRLGWLQIPERAA